MPTISEFLGQSLPARALVDGAPWSCASRVLGHQERAGVCSGPPRSCSLARGWAQSGLRVKGLLNEYVGK